MSATTEGVLGGCKRPGFAPRVPSLREDLQTWLACRAVARGDGPPTPFGLRRGSLRYDRACLAEARFASEGWWGKKDSNLRSRKTADLQSAPFATRDTPPSNNIASPTAWRRRIRPWMTLIPRADGMLPVGAFMGEGGWQSQPRQAAKNGPGATQIAIIRDP